jgi:hypothetical protein
MEKAGKGNACAFGSIGNAIKMELCVFWHKTSCHMSKSKTQRFLLHRRDLSKVQANEERKFKFAEWDPFSESIPFGEDTAENLTATSRNDTARHH